MSQQPIRFMPPLDAPGQAPLPDSPSLTYEPYYGLKEKPFSLSADPRFLYRSPAHAPAFDELLNGIRRREGLIVLTGEIGTGKTTLIRSVLQHLDRRTFTALVPDPFVSREDLLKMLLVDFGVVSISDLKRGSLAGASRPDLSYPLYEFLDSLVPLQAFAVLIVDEAQNLPLHLLEEIRILSDLEQREKLLQVVLVGQPELRSNLKLPEMRQVDQRVSVRCELLPLSLEDVAEYVRVRLDVASGGDNHVQFSDDALATVFRGSGGVPRVINLICDRALQRGHLARASLIDSKLVEQAIKALGLEIPDAQAVATTTGESRRPASEVRTAGAGPLGAGPSKAGPSPVEPAVVQPPRPTSVPILSARPAAPPAQFLSEFAAEMDLARRSGRRLRLWRLAASLLMAALAAAAIAAIWYVYLVSGPFDVSAATLPPSPAWRTIGALGLPRPSIDSPPEAASPRSGRETPVPVPPGDGSYVIQVATFESAARADRLVEELTVAGFGARTVAVDLGTSGQLLQIRVEGYPTLEAAQQDLARIQAIPGYADAHLVTN